MSFRRFLLLWCKYSHDMFRQLIIGNSIEMHSLYRYLESVPYTSNYLFHLFAVAPENYAKKFKLSTKRKKEPHPHFPKQGWREDYDFMVEDVQITCIVCKWA